MTQLASGRWQARYVGHDGIRHPAPSTFDDKGTAHAWLSRERVLYEDVETWEPPKVRASRSRKRLSFGVYAGRWIEERTLKERTRYDYGRLLEQHLLPTFGSLPLTGITPELVKAWHAGMGSDRPTLRSHAYSLLRSILGDAEREELIARNPCHIRGAGNVKRKHKIEPASLTELADVVAAMPERFRAMTLLAAWCALRFGELTELRRKDVDLAAGVIHVRRAVSRVGGRPVTGTPKSEAGIREVAIPPHLLPLLQKHLDDYVAAGREALIFPGAGGGPLAPSSLYGRRKTPTRVGWGFYEARRVAGREDLRWHDLRHTGAVLAAATGATLAELMSRLGHSTPGAALLYQHAAKGRDAEIARMLSVIAESGAVDGP